MARGVVLGGGAVALIAWLLLGSRRGAGVAGGQAGLAALAEATGQPLAPCKVRLDSRGWSINGERMPNVAAVVAACRGRHEVRLFVTGGANFGRLIRGRAALMAAGLALIEESKT